MASAVGPDIITNGLIFAVDAGSTRSYPGSGTAVTDLAGANTGALVNGVGYSTNQGGKWNFDGTDEQMLLNSGTPIEVNNFTISQWIQFPSTTSRMTIGGGFYNTSPVQEYRGYIWYRSPQNEIRVMVNNETGVVFSVSESAYVSGFHKVTATRSGSTYKLYLDGVQVDTARTGSTNLFCIRTIGWSYSNGYAFEGDIANTLIYNRGLTDAEEAQNFNAQRKRFGI